MAQFRKDTHQFLNDGKTIFESVMLADQYGNIVGAAESQIEPQDIYKYQLERQPFGANNVGLIYTLCATGAANGADAVGAIQWEEIT